MKYLTQRGTVYWFMRREHQSEDAKPVIAFFLGLFGIVGFQKIATNPQDGCEVDFEELFRYGPSALVV